MAGLWSAGFPVGGAVVWGCGEVSGRRSSCCCVIPVVSPRNRNGVLMVFRWLCDGYLIVTRLDSNRKGGGVLMCNVLIFNENMSNIFQPLRAVSAYLRGWSRVCPMGVSVRSQGCGRGVFVGRQGDLRDLCVCLARPAPARKASAIAGRWRMMLHATGREAVAGGPRRSKFSYQTDKWLTF